VFRLNVHHKLESTFITVVRKVARKLSQFIITYLRTRQRGWVNWFGHILFSNCLLKHIIEGKIEGMERRGRRHKQPLDDLKEKRRYCHLKDKELDSFPWRNFSEKALDFSQGRRRNECIHLSILPVIKMTLDILVVLHFSSKLTHVN